MNRPLTALFAALEAALVVGVGVAIPLVPLTIMWAVQFGLQVDWAEFWRAAVDIWLVGHGVDLELTLGADAAASLGLAGADATFPVTIAALGFALLTFLLAVRAGRRVSETRFRLVGEIAAVATFGVLSLVLALTADAAAAKLPVAEAVLLPTAVFLVGVVVGSLRTRREAPGPDEDGSSLRDWIADWDPLTRTTVASVLRGGAASAIGVLAVAGVVLAVCLVVGYARIITLYESLHTEALGGVAVTLGELALLPNFVIWTASWLVGPGFAIGTGSSVSPIATQLGPVPAVPILGALPDSSAAFALVGIAVPVVVGFVTGLFAQRWLEPQLPSESRVGRLVATGVGIGVIGGLLLGLLAWFSGGAAGPGRLVDVGPSPFAVAGLAALEVAVGTVAALLVADRRAERAR